MFTFAKLKKYVYLHIKFAILLSNIKVIYNTYNYSYKYQTFSLSVYIRIYNTYKHTYVRT